MKFESLEALDWQRAMRSVDLALIERWLTCWSLSRGVPLPLPHNGGLVVEVGLPDQLRRYVFADAGPALQACAQGIREPQVFLKAPVEPDVLRRALPAGWDVEGRGYFMAGPPQQPADVLLPAGYRLSFGREHGAQLVRVMHDCGDVAARGGIVLHGRCAVFDRIETAEAHRRRGLGTVVMRALDAIAARAGVEERLLVATADGRGLYESLGWHVVAPWSTAFLNPGTGKPGSGPQGQTPST